MITDDLIRVIRKFIATSGRGPSFKELRDMLVNELDSAVSEADLVEELDKAMQGGFIRKDDKGNFVDL